LEIIYLDKGKRDYNFDKSTNYTKLAKEKFLYLPYYPLPDLSDYIGEIIEVHNLINNLQFDRFIFYKI